MKQDELRKIFKKLGVSSYEYSVWLSKRHPGELWREINHRVEIANFAKGI